MMPNNALSSTPVPSPFLAPRTNIRFSTQAGMVDTHFGGIAIGDASHGLQYQIWTCRTDGNNVFLSAANTLPFIQLANVQAQWVALAFDQGARPVIAYATKLGQAFYYFFDTVANAFVTRSLSGVIPRIFASLDDQRPALIAQSDVLICYVRAGTLFMRVQRDRFGVEYTLGAAPATLVQIGMDLKYRFQFAFQNVQGNSVLPPSEWSPALGFNETA